MGNARSATYSNYSTNNVHRTDLSTMGSSYVRKDDFPQPQFVRQRNIRLQRPNKEATRLQSHGNREKSRSGSVMVLSRSEDNNKSLPVQETLRATPCSERMPSLESGRETSIQQHNRIQYRAASCNALLQSDVVRNAVHELKERRNVSKDWSFSDITNVRRPLSRQVTQYLSLRSYRGSQRRRDALTRNSALHPVLRSAASASSLLVSDSSALRLKLKSYLEDAKQRKESVEQTLTNINHLASFSNHDENRRHHSNVYSSNLLLSQIDHETDFIEKDFSCDDNDNRHPLVDSCLMAVAVNQVTAPDSLAYYSDDSFEYGVFTCAAADFRPSRTSSLRSQSSDTSCLTLVTANTSLSSLHPPVPSTDSRQLHTYYPPRGDATYNYECSSGTFYLESLKRTLGQIPPYVEIRQGRLHLKLTRDDVMDECDGAVRVCEITDILRAEYAIITGGRSREGRPIITFPDRCNFASLSDDDYRKLVIYLSTVPPLQDADLDYVLIVDRRTDRWNSVKATLLKISSFFPGLIAVVYVLRPSGLLQKAISEVSNKFFRDDFKFKVVVCSGLEELHQRIDPSQLTPELGGYLLYNHKEWIDTRVAVESFSTNTADISAALRKFSRRLQDTELPNDVQTTQTLINSQSQEYRHLKDELRNACIQGETLLHLIKNPNMSSTKSYCEPWPGQLVNITTVERLLIQMEETERTLHEFWHRHEAHLNLCLQLRKFELDFREAQTVFDSHVQYITKMDDDVDAVARIDTLLQETAEYQQNCQEDLDHADALYNHAAKLMVDYAHSPAVLDSVRPKSIELQRMCQTLRDLLTKRLQSLHKSRDLYDRIEKANRWCSQGVDLLTSQQLEKCSSPEFALQALSDIEQFLSSASEFRLSDPKEFRIMFQDLITPETKALIHQVIQRLQDVHVMCERRVTGLKQIVTRIRTARPVQPVPPEPVVPVPSQVRKTTTSPDGDNTVQAAFNAKLGHVLTELMETERIYVSEIATILKGYRDPLIDPYRPVPAVLLEKADVLFGNLPDIHNFHGEIFLPDLECSLSSPQLVATCFLRHIDTFHELYSFYCQNTPQSEELRRQVGEQNAFLRECQLQLGHKLPLSAYLLKPVQRITKYQLLLKDLVKYSQCDNPSEDMKNETDLQSALDAMLAVLRCVNDSMHQVAIVGYQGSLAELGRLLLQGSFSVWAEGKRDRLKELRLKPMQRHVFLYDRGVVLCKRVGKDPDKATYHFKHLLKMSEVGLTETVHNGRGSDARKFELWLQGRQEVWVLQAPARDVKETWITEVKRVLLSQFHQLKGQTIQNTNTRASVSNGSGVCTNANTKNTGASSQGVTPLHKPLRQTSSWEYGNLTGSTTSSSSGIGSTGDRNSIVESSSGSTTTGRLSTGGRLVRSATADEDDGWSTDFSLSDDDGGESYLEHVEPLRCRYIALADYAPLGPTEAALKEGDIVDLVRIGCAGWWYVRPAGSTISSSQEGWAPSAYLEPAPTVKSPCSSGTPSVSSQDSEQENCLQ